MMRFLARAAILAALAVTSVSAEDLAWRFDASARPADVTAEAVAANAGAVDAAPAAEGVSGTIPLFDSRWTYSLLLEGWTYQYVRGFCIILR